jgi:hypothetical protein
MTVSDLDDTVFDHLTSFTRHYLRGAKEDMRHDKSPINPISGFNVG